MKKYIIISLFTFAFSNPAVAERLYGMAGCGLGAVAIGADGGQIFAATTNGTSFNQGFGITSGTLNCLEPSKMAALESQKSFFQNNLEQLSKEMAQGNGEYLAALSQTFGCETESYGEFSSEMKTSYQEIFSSPGAMSMLSEVRNRMKSNPQLSKSCANLI